MNTPRCRRCGKLPEDCPCLTNPDAWDADKLPVTVLNSGVVVKVVGAFQDYRVCILLPSHRLRNEVERRDTLDVADRWQRAIEERCGTYQDSYRLRVDRAIYQSRSATEFAEASNDRIREATAQALNAQESLDRPGRWIRDLLFLLREWFPTAGKAEEVADEILERARAGEELPYDDGILWPVDENRVFNRRRKWKERESQARAFEGDKYRSRLPVPIEAYHLIEPPEVWQDYLSELETLAQEALGRHFARRFGVVPRGIARLAVEAGESLEQPGVWVRDLLWRLRPWNPTGREAEDLVRWFLDEARADPGAHEGEHDPESGE